MKKKLILTALIVFIQTSLFASDPDHFHVLMKRVHSSGDGLPGIVGSSHVGAYAIKTNGYEYVDGEPYDPNNGPYEFWSMTYGAHQLLRKFTLGVDGSNWLDHFDGYGYTSFYSNYGSYADSDVRDAGLDNPVGTSILYASESNLGRVASGSPDFSEGVCSVYIGGSFRTGSFVLNPAPLTFNGVTYQPEELALVTSIDGSSLAHFRKVVLLYDLRQIGEYTDRKPDYNTGQDGLGHQTPLYGAYNQTDWNDCFYPLVTGQMILDTIDDDIAATAFNYGRQAIWAPDASAVYFAGFTLNNAYNENDADSIKYYNGIWKYDFRSNQLSWIRRDRSREDRMYYCEMAALPTTQRDFTDGAESGLQILFSSEVENVGGISCIVDEWQYDPYIYDPNTSDPNTYTDDSNSCYDPNDFSNPVLYTVLDTNDFADATETHPLWNEVRNIIIDPNGNIYFYCVGQSDYINYETLYLGSHSLYKYDVEGRVYSVSNRATYMNFHYSNGSSLSGSTGAIGAFQYYPNLFGKEMLTYRSTPLYEPCGIELFKPVDFNHDGNVDILDLIIFRDQRINNDSWLEPHLIDDPNDQTDIVMPGIFEVDLDYINCDINGNSMYRNLLIDNSTGMPAGREVLEDLDNLIEENYSVETDKQYFKEKAVTEADAEILYQFIPAGDANLDGTVDIDDFCRLAANFNSGNSTDDRKDFSQGDFDFDGDVDINDLELQCLYWLSESVPVSAD